MNRRRGGFTLMEALLAALLGSLALAAILGLLAGGLRVAERVRAGGEWIDLALVGAQIERDLRNAVPFYALEFTGDSDGVEFAGWSEGMSPERPVRIRYGWDPRRGELRRTVTPYPGTVPIRDEVLMGGLSECRWTFLNPETATASRPAWLEGWAGEGRFPAAVRWEVRRRAGGSRRGEMVW